MSLHQVAARKLQTALAIRRHTSNWGWLWISRILPWLYQGPVRLRSGISIYPRETLHGSWGEIFEPAIADCYGLRNVPAIDVFWDVGANIGAFSCVAGHMFPEARIVAYEPDSDAVHALQRNLSGNRIGNVTIIPFPVTRDGRDVTFTRTAGGASNIYGCNEGSLMHMPSRMLETSGMDPRQRLLVKLDCEGSEGELTEWIAENGSHLPAMMRVIGEFHPWCPRSPDDISRSLQAAGFRVTWGDRFGEKYFDAVRQW